MTEHTEREPLPPHVRRHFDVALSRSVDALFGLDAVDALTLMSEWFEGRAIFVLTPNAMWARHVDDASAPDEDAPRPEPGARWPEPPAPPALPAPSSRLADMPPSAPDAWAVLKAAKELGEDAEDAAVTLRAWEHGAATDRPRGAGSLPLTFGRRSGVPWS